MDGPGVDTSKSEDVDTSESEVVDTSESEVVDTSESEVVDTSEPEDEGVEEAMLSVWKFKRRMRPDERSAWEG